MGINDYIDGIMALLEQAGVQRSELEQNGTEPKLVHAFIKGLDFDEAAIAVLKEHRVRIVE